MQNTFLGNLSWRYAVKGFDTSKKVSDENLHKIKDAIRMTPSSFGLQPYHCIIVTDEAVKAEIKAAAYGQGQVDSASHLFVFISNKDMQSRISEFCDLVERKSQGLFDRVKQEATMRGFAMLLDDAGKRKWATEQTHIAAGFALAACTELSIDSCPMGGFSADKVKDILKLSANQNVEILLPIGYRLEDSKYEKVRFGEEDLFENR
jgi:nitroreductase